MSRLDELITDVAKMDDDALLDLVRSIRSQRKKRTPRKAPTAMSGEKRKDKVKALLGSLSPEERNALLAKIK